MIGQLCHVMKNFYILLTRSSFFLYNLRLCYEKTDNFEIIAHH